MVTKLQPTFLALVFKLRYISVYTVKQSDNMLILSIKALCAEARPIMVSCKCNYNCDNDQASLL